MGKIKYSILLICCLPVCVEFICAVKQVESGDVTEGSRLNCFLLGKQQVFSSVDLVTTFLNRRYTKEFNLPLTWEGM